MNSSKTATLIIVTALIMLLIIPIQSTPTRQKRWTFNSWRLHGRRNTSPAPTTPTTESYYSTISTDENHQDQPLKVDDDSYQMLLRLLQLFQTLDHEQKEKDNNIKYF